MTETAAGAGAQASWVQTRTVVRVILIVLAVAVALWMLYRLRGVILLVALAIFFAYLIAPMVEVFHRPITLRGRERTLPRALAIAIVYGIVFGTIGIALSLMLPRLGHQMTQFARQTPLYASYARDRIEGWSSLLDTDSLPPAVREPVSNAVGRTMEQMGQAVTTGLTSMIGVLGYLPWLILIPILAFFLLKDAETFRRSALLLFPRGASRWRAAELFQDINSALAAYIRAQLTACLLIGLFCTVGFAIIGVPYTLVLGVVAGLLEFIPLVGPLLVAVVAIIIAAFYSVAKALAVLLFLGLLRIVQDYVIYPRLIGHGIHMHPLAVILAILCGAALAGVVGIFLAIPVIAVLTVGYRHWLEHRGGTVLVAELMKPADESVIGPPIAPHQARASAPPRNA